MDESEQTAAELDQDPGHVAWLWPAAEACRHQRHPVVVDHRPGRRQRAGPWSYPRQPADTIGARRSALLVWLLPAQTTSPARPVDDGGRCGVYFLPIGLLQFAALRAAGHSTAQAAVCAECHCTTNHWHATQRSYLTGITRTPLATLLLPSVL